MRLAIRQCSRKENCINPAGSWLPETEEYFCPCKRLKMGLSYQCRACTREYNRLWRREKLKNPEAREKSREQQRIYNNKPSTKERTKAQRQKPESKIRHALNERKRRERPEVRMNITNWRQSEEGRLYRRVYEANRRTKLLQNGGRHSADDIIILYQKQNGCCKYCGVKLGDKYDVDHIIPISRGGTNDSSNLAIACVHCNRSKHDKLPHEWKGSASLESA